MPIGTFLSRHRLPIGWGLGLLALAALSYATTGDPHLRHTSAVNAIFDARWLVAGARLLAALVMLYLLGSIGVRVHRHQWVRSAGSVDTDPAPAQAIADDRVELQQQLANAKRTIDDLAERLDRSLADRTASRASMETARGSGYQTEQGRNDLDDDHR